MPTGVAVPGVDAPGPVRRPGHPKRSPAIRHDGRRRFWTNISARTSTMADNATAKFENVQETDFANGLQNRRARNQLSVGAPEEKRRAQCLAIDFP